MREKANIINDKLKNLDARFAQNFFYREFSANILYVAMNITVAFM